MRGHYVYKKPVKRSHYSNFRRYMIIIVLFLVAFGVVSYFIYSGLKSKNDSVTSEVENTEITGNSNTFSNDYFEFQDSGTWVIDKNNSDAHKITYHKFRKNVLEHEMIVYINQDPIPLYVEVPRALPVRVVNANRLQATNVSSPCVGQYAKGELHKVKEVSINGATILCDPDSPQYYVILSEINGDYHLKLKRSNGTPIQFVITYKDVSLSSLPDSVTNIANTFKAK